MEGPAAAYQTLSQLVYKLLTAGQDYETTGSEETLKTVIDTDGGQPYHPRAAMDQNRNELMALWQTACASAGAFSCGFGRRAGR